MIVLFHAKGYTKTKLDWCMQFSEGSFTISEIAKRYPQSNQCYLILG
jgi:hypothetical protein